MSLPGPPAGGNGLVAGRINVKTSRDSRRRDETLWRLVEKAGNRNDRWELVCHLRLLLLVLTGVAVEGAAYPALRKRQRAVLAGGRLSTVGVELGIQKIVNNPEHLNLDWFGPDGVNWWDTKIDPIAAEKAVAEGILHYFERSLGLAESGVGTDEWSWPPGTDNNRKWYDLITDNNVQPAGGVGFDDLAIEWHIGASGNIGCVGATELRIETPWTSNQDIAHAADVVVV